MLAAAHKRMPSSYVSLADTHSGCTPANDHHYPYARRLAPARAPGSTLFAEYCKRCRSTLPATEQLHAKYDGEVVFVGVSEDVDEPSARRVVATYGLTFPVVHDPDRLIAERFHVTQLPATFVIDSEGVVQWIARPSYDESDLERAIEGQTR